MKRLILLLVLLIPAPGGWAADADPLQQSSLAMNDQQPELQTYRTVVETDQVATMLARMTANMPPGMARPQVPTLVKYWAREHNAFLVRAEGAQVFPYMQEMIGRFSAEFAVDLYGMFLPPQRAGERQALLGQAAVVLRDEAGSDGVLQAVEVRFAGPVDLGGAFYRGGLGLPQQGIARLVLALDPSRHLLRRLDVTPARGPAYSVALTYESHGDLHLPARLHLHGDRGRLETRVVTSFARSGGFWVPVQQQQFVRQGEQVDERLVSFLDYQINIPLPPEVVQRMTAR